MNKTIQNLENCCASLHISSKADSNSADQKPVHADNIATPQSGVQPPLSSPPPRTPTFKEVWEARFHRNPYITPDDKNARKLLPKVVEFAEFFGADFDTTPASVFGPDFERNLALFMAEKFGSYRKGGTTLCGRREVEAGLRDCRKIFMALGPIDLKALPIGFGPRLRYLIQFRSFSTNILAERVGSHGPMIRRWMSRNRRPDPTSKSTIERIEQILDVPKGTLLALPDLAYLAHPGREISYSNRFGQTPIGRYFTDIRDRFPDRESGRCLHPDQWRGQLALEWADLQQSKSWCKRTIDGHGYYAGCFFAYAVNVRGYALNNLSFALFLAPNLVREYLEWDRECNEPNKIYNSRANHFLKDLVRPLLRAPTGWLVKQHHLVTHSSFAGKLPGSLVVKDFAGSRHAKKTIYPSDPVYSQYVWAMYCSGARDDHERLAADIKHHRDNSRHRLTWNRKEAIQPILDLVHPLSAITGFFRGLKECEVGALTPFAVHSALRDRVIFELGVTFRLRAKTIATLKWEKNIYLDANKQMRLRLTRRELGYRGCGGEALALDLELAVPGFGSANVAETITAYLIHGHQCLTDLKPGDPIIVSPRPDHIGPVTAQMLTQRATKLTAQILAEFTPNGFSFHGFALIISECLARAGEESLAANWLSPLAPLDVGNASPVRVQQRQEALFREFMGKIMPPQSHEDQKSGSARPAADKDAGHS